MRHLMPAARALPLHALWLAATLQLARSTVWEVVDLVPLFHHTREEFSARWRYDPNVVCTAPGLRGAVNKTGSGHDMWAFLDRSRSIDPDLPDVATGIPFYSSTQVYVSHKYKFIYLRIPKASSSSIITTLFMMYCAEQEECESGEIQRLSQEGSKAEYWRDYFVFTVVRNPIARMLSTYIMFTERLRYRPDPSSHKPGDYCNIPFLAFSEDTLRMRTACDTDRCCAFVAFGKQQFVEHYANTHISQQVQFVLTPAWEPIVDYIGSTETVNEDWKEIVQRIAQRSGINIPHQPISHNNSAGVHLQGLARLGLSPVSGAAAPPCIEPNVAALGLLNATTVTNLARQFCMDMVMLKYLPTDWT